MTGGLQLERTYLAWRRTAMSLAAVGILVVHESPVPGWVGPLVASPLVLALAATVAGSAELRYARCQPSGYPTQTPPAVFIAVVAAGTTVPPLALLLSQLFAHGRW